VTDRHWLAENRRPTPESRLSITPSPDHRITRWVCVSVLLGLILVLLCGCNPSRQRIVIGSKNFTEQAILGEFLAQYLEGHGFPVERRFYLAGTYVCQQAILAGRIDLYVEYTGTALTAILKEPPVSDPAVAYAQVKETYARRFGLAVTAPLGFDNSFAIVVRGDEARRLHLHTISDVVTYAPHWRAGFGYEFMERKDGFPGLARTYGLHFAEPPRIMDLGLLYRALESRQVDLIAGSATDGLISALDLRVLQDDRHYFPSYSAVPVVRQQTLQVYARLESALSALAGKINEQEMRQMNFAVDAQHRDPKQVVAEYLRGKGL
jgi:osmoprotectant transport system substrate-binding protein